MLAGSSLNETVFVFIPDEPTDHQLGRERRPETMDWDATSVKFLHDHWVV